MSKLECKPFGKEHTEATNKIALDNYMEEREFVPELPENVKITGTEFFVENGYGVAALEEGRCRRL